MSIMQAAALTRVGQATRSQVILMRGDLCVEEETGQWYVGDGVTTGGIQITNPVAIATAQVQFASGSDYTLNSQNACSDSLFLVGPLAAQQNLFFPATLGNYWIVHNGTGQTVQCLVAGQTGVALANGKTQLFLCNGTDIVAAGSAV